MRLTSALAITRQPSVSRPSLTSAPLPPVRTRSAAPLSPHEQSTTIREVGHVADRSSEPEDDAVIATPPRLEDVAPPPLDEAAEAEFLAGAKERGEVVVPKPAAEVEETVNPKQLPPLDELVAKIPAEVKEVLEDLFRARWTTVKKFPKKALKEAGK